MEKNMKQDKNKLSVIGVVVNSVTVLHLREYHRHFLFNSRLPDYYY